jgi:hypothetical protein
MKHHFTALLFTTCLVMTGGAFSLDSQTPESWDREKAWRSSVSVNTQNTRSQLHELLIAGDSPGILALIRKIEQRADWPTPARERVLLDFVNDLRKETPRAISAEVIEHLGRYKSKVFVADQDHPQASVPMFNIRAATAGVVNTWARREATYQGSVLLASGSQYLVRAYLEQENVPARYGLLDALSTASLAQLKDVIQRALSDVEKDPRLLALVGKAALLAKDLDTLEILVEIGQGPDMLGLLRGSAQILDAEQSSRLLHAALRSPSVETAKLALALLTPVLSGHQPTEDLLLRELGNPDLGPTAAYVLVRNPSTSALEKLEVLAASDERSLPSSRARIALEIYAFRINEGL